MLPEWISSGASIVPGDNVRVAGVTDLLQNSGNYSFIGLSKERENRRWVNRGRPLIDVGQPTSTAHTRQTERLDDGRCDHKSSLKVEHCYRNLKAVFVVRRFAKNYTS